MRAFRARRLARPTAHGHRLGALAALVGLFLGAVATAAPSGAAQPITPTDITVTVTTKTQDVGGADPFVLAEVDNQSATDKSDELTVRLDLVPAGATFNQDTPVTLTVGGLGSGTFTPSKVTFPRDVEFAVFEGITYDKVESGISMLASAGKGQKVVTSTKPSNVFDIQYDLVLQDKTTQNVTLGADTCTVSSQVLCAVVLLPNGVPSRAALATGACTTYYADCTRTDGRIISFMADLVGTYGPTNPVTIVLRCDKSYCKGGGVSSYAVLARPNWKELTFSEAPACQVKGQVPDAPPYYCVDYVQSHRDNAGDLILYWLVARDPRGTV